MRKFLIGCAVGVLLAAAGSYLAVLFVRQQVESEVEKAFEGARAVFATAAHGRMDIDLWNRSLAIRDIILESRDEPRMMLRIAQVTAKGLWMPSAGRVTADRIEIANYESSGPLFAGSRQRIVQRAPTITIDAFAGSLAPPKVTQSVARDLPGLLARQLAGSSAAAILVPSVSAAVTPAQAPGGRSAEYAYSNLAFRNFQDGVGDISIERVTASDPGIRAGAVPYTMELVNVSVTGFDAATLLAVLDPARASDQRELSAYRRIAAGPMTMTLERADPLRIEGFLVEDVRMRPAKLDLAGIMALSESLPASVAPGRGAPPAAQLTELFEKVAGLYEGIRIGKMEVRGLSTSVPPGGKLKVGTIRMDRVENGRIGEFAVEGIEGGTAREPVSMRRFALKGFDAANLLRTSGRWAALRGPPKPDEIAGLLALLEGFELADLVAPNAVTRELVRLETLAASWGNFVGSIPSTARVSAKVSMPLDLANPGPFKVLTDGGLRMLKMDLNLASAWSETTQKLTVGPAVIEIGNLFSGSARIVVDSVPREAFTADPVLFLFAAGLFEAGPAEISVRDAGGVALLVGEFAKEQGLTPETARAMLVQNMQEHARALAQTSPDVAPATEALARFMQLPGSTLSIKITPVDRVYVQQLLEEAIARPDAALGRFKVEVTASRP